MQCGYRIFPGKKKDYLVRMTCRDKSGTGKLENSVTVSMTGQP